MSKKSKTRYTKVDIEIPEAILDDIIYSIYSVNHLVNRKFITNIYNLLRIINPEIYEENDESVFIKYIFIKKSVRGYLKENIRDFNILYNHTLEKNKYEDSIIEIVEPMIRPILTGLEDSLIDTDGIEYVSTYVSENIQYSYLYHYSNEIQDTFDRLINRDYDSLRDINTETKELLKTVLSDIRKSEIDNNAFTEIDLSEGNFQNVVSLYTRELQNPSKILATGYQAFNKMWNGGVESSRCYLCLSVSGGGKSKFALNLAESICLCNDDIELKDPLKRPCVVLLHQENSQRETFGRYFSMKTKDKYDIKDLTETEVLDILAENGVSPDREINLKIIFKKTKSISTDDVYSIIEEIEDDGNEVICLIHDYTKRINPSKPTGDIRLDLGNVVDEFNILSKILDIPVILFGQLNREAMRIVENALIDGVTDIVKLLGSSNVGESSLMIENADTVEILQDEYSEEYEKWFLTCKEVKMRGKQSTLTHFAHPYENSCSPNPRTESRLSLVMDYFGEPEYKEELTPGGAYSHRKPSKEKTYKTQERYSVKASGIEDDDDLIDD